MACRGQVQNNVPVIILDDEDRQDIRSTTHLDTSLSDTGDDVVIVPLASAAAQNINDVRQDDVMVELIEDSDTQSGPPSQKTLSPPVEYSRENSRAMEEPSIPVSPLPHLDMRALPPISVRSLPASTAPRMDSTRICSQQLHSPPLPPPFSHSPSSSFSRSPEKLQGDPMPPSTPLPSSKVRRRSRSRFSSLTPPQTFHSLAQPVSQSPVRPQLAILPLPPPPSNSQSVSLSHRVPPTASSGLQAPPAPDFAQVLPSLLPTSEPSSLLPSPSLASLPQPSSQPVEKPKKSLAELKKQILLSMKKPTKPCPAPTPEQAIPSEVDLLEKARTGVNTFKVPLNTFPTISLDCTPALEDFEEPDVDGKAPEGVKNGNLTSELRVGAKPTTVEYGIDAIGDPNFVPEDLSAKHRRGNRPQEVLTVTLTASDVENDPYSDYVNRPSKKRKLSIEEQIEDMKIRVVHLGKCPSELHGLSSPSSEIKLQEAKYMNVGSQGDSCAPPVVQQEITQAQAGSVPPTLQSGPGIKSHECIKSSDRANDTRERTMKVEGSTLAPTSEAPKHDNKGAAPEAVEASADKGGHGCDTATTSNPSNVGTKAFDLKRKILLGCPDSNSDVHENSQKDARIESGALVTNDVRKKACRVKATPSDIRALKQKIADLEKIREKSRIVRGRGSGTGMVTRNLSLGKDGVVAETKVASNGGTSDTKKCLPITALSRKGNKQGSGIGRARYYETATGIQKLSDSEGIVCSASDGSGSPERDVSAKWNETDPSLRGNQNCTIVDEEKGQLNHLKTELEMSKKELMMMQDYSNMMQRATISVAEAAAKVSFKRGRLESIEAELKKVQLEVQEAEQDYQKITQAALAMRSSMKGGEDSDFSFPELEILSPTSLIQGKSNSSNDGTGESRFDGGAKCANTNTNFQSSEPGTSSGSRYDVVLRPSPFSPSGNDEIVSPLSAFRSYALNHSIVHWKRVLTVPGCISF